MNAHSRRKPRTGLRTTPRRKQGQATLGVWSIYSAS